VRKGADQVNTMQLVLLALLRCGGDQRFVSTDEVALEAFKLYPGKFCWEEYPHLPQWDKVRQWLSEAKKPKHGTLVEGYGGQRWEGYRLTAAGVRLLRFKEKALSEVTAMPAPEEDYRELLGSSLVAAAVAELEAANRVPDFPVVVHHCYARFPDRFELRGYSGWPDACSVQDGIDEAIGLSQMVKREANGVVELTAEGRSKAAETLAKVARPVAAVRLAEIGKGLTGKFGRQIAEISRSRAWVAYESGHKLSKGAACEAIQCTLQSHPNAIRRALEAYHLAAEELGRQDVMQFLAACADVIGVELRMQPTSRGGNEDGA